MDNIQTASKKPATEAIAETPTVKTEAPKAEAEVKAEEVSTETTEPGTEAEVEEGGKKTANARIRELNAKAKAAEAKAQSLAERVAELTGSFDPGAQAYEPPVEPGAEVTPEQYRADVARQADQIVQLRMKQKEVLDRVNDESREAIKAYPQLYPSSGEFDGELSESISKATLALVSRTPTASVREFVDSLMKPYLRSVEKEVGEARGEMARQVTQAALRPTTVREREKTASEMSLKELEQKLGVVY